MRRVALTLSALTATSLLLSACGGSSSSTPAADPQPVASGQTITQFWPLTGLEVPSNKTSALDHPVLVAKMDNTVSSQPQVGLSKADMVVEELVEGGLTRLAAFYYSDIPTNVGPIRSMRASDIPVVSPVHASMVTSGAANRTIALIKGADIPFYSEGSKGFYRSSQRPSALQPPGAPQRGRGDREGEGRDAAGLPHVGHRQATCPRASRRPRSARSSPAATPPSGSSPTGATTTSTATLPAGDQFPATNVLVLRVKEGNAGYLDPAGNPVPKTLLVGKGNALLFHNGRMVAANWEKGKAPDSQIKLTTKKGDTLKVPAGHTWIELVPVDGGNVTFKK